MGVEVYVPGERQRVRNWELVLLERAYEGITISAGERCLEHQEGVKERVEDGLKERKGTRDGQRRASCEITER